MKILLSSDWHLDYWRGDGRDPLAASGFLLEDLDALILAGDLAEDPLRTWPAWLEWLGQRIEPAKVHITPGNHDYYDHRLDGDNAMRAIVESAGMTFAQKQAIFLGDLRFLCCTLWTDFRLIGHRMQAMSDARWMEDYARIARDTGGEIVMPADTLAAHEDHLAWLTGAIRPPHQGWTVIVSHHLPSGSVAGSISPLSPVFASNLEPWILEHRPDLWLCGHSHRHREAWIGTTLIRDISLGYPEEVAEGRAPELLMRGLVDSRASDLLIH